MWSKNSKKCKRNLWKAPNLLERALQTEPQQSRQHRNARRPHAPCQCPQCAQLLIHLQFFLNIAQTRNWGKKISSNWLVSNNTIEYYSTYCCRLTNFWLELLEVCRRAGFCFVFLKKKLVKLSEVHVLQRRFDEFCGFWKLESFEERDDRIDFKCGKLKNF